jgi:pyroglutamyl-peptidase
MKVLLTGFGGWGGDSVNPAYKLIQFFADKRIDDAQIITRELPIDTRKTSSYLVDLLEEVHPDIYIGIGSAPGRSIISLERIAINVLDFPIPDNEGNQPIDEPIYHEGPVAYYSTLPIKSIVHELRENGVPAKVSNTAGTYICNQTMYTGLYYAAKKNHALKAGFIHVPILPEQKDSLLQGVPSVSFDIQAKAMELAIKVSLRVDEDIKAEGGAAS